MWYRYRRGPRLRHLWFLVIPLFFFGGHGGFGIILGIASIIALALIARAVFTMMAGSNTWSMRQNSWYQPRNQQSYYQPTQQQQPYYQPTQQQPYSSYQQGYQPYYQPHTDSNQPANGQQYEAQQQAYDQYEQPQSEYPQELPPMQQ